MDSLIGKQSSIVITIELDMDYKKLSIRIDNGWSIHDTFTIPIGIKRKDFYKS